MIKTADKFVNDIIKCNITTDHAYEILEYMVAPSQSEMDTGLTVDSTMVVDMTCTLNSEPNNSRRFFSSNDTGTDAGWSAAGTWGLQFEDSTRLSVKPLGYTADVVRTSFYYSNFAQIKLHYRLEAAGPLSVYSDDGPYMFSADYSSYTDPTVTSSSNLKLFNRLLQNNGRECIAPGTLIYETKIWKNNTLVRHYKPVKRLSDNVVGYYDVINDTFLTNAATGFYFTGVSKSTPEYIDEQVNDILHINRIYNRGEIYWGNTTPPTPPAPTKTNTITGKGRANVTYTNALRINGQDWTVTTDSEGNFILQLNAPVYDITDGTADIFYNGISGVNTITELDLTDLVYDNENGVSLGILTNTRSNRAQLTDIWFDFRDLTKINRFSWNLRVNISNACYIHGLGTLNVVFPEGLTTAADQGKWCLREGSNNGRWAGTFDIRGIDTHNVIDWPRAGRYPIDASYGGFYNWPGNACYCDTLIIGNLEWPYNRFSGWNRFTTLYCTTATPPSLDRTGLNGITAKNYVGAMTSLSHIYVPTGCLAAYQNASTWSNYANKMSELDAPDPMTI